MLTDPAFYFSRIHFQFQKSGCIASSDSHYVARPSLKDRVHTIVFMLDGETLELIDPDTRKKLERVKELGVRKSKGSFIISYRGHTHLVESNWGFVHSADMYKPWSKWSVNVKNVNVR